MIVVQKCLVYCQYVYAYVFIGCLTSWIIQSRPWILLQDLSSEIALSECHENSASTTSVSYCCIPKNWFQAQCFIACIHYRCLKGCLGSPCCQRWVRTVKTLLLWMLAYPDVTPHVTTSKMVGHRNGSWWLNLFRFTCTQAADLFSGLVENSSGTL